MEGRIEVGKIDGYAETRRGGRDVVDIWWEGRGEEVAARKEVKRKE